jgi:hypothetical protein
VRRSIAALCLVAVALLQACGRDEPPNSLFESAGYHVRGEKVFYLAAFPGKASEIAGADAGTFTAFDFTYAKDKSTVYFDGRPISGADATTFTVLDRSGFAKDRNHVYQLDRAMSDDPAHFELLDGGLSKDSTAVYWTDGAVLSDDPTHFAIVSTNDHYLYTKDAQSVHVNGNPIADADPLTFRVLQGAYAQDAHHVFYFSDQVAAADAASFRPLDGPYADRAYYRQTVIGGADPHTFPPGRAVTNCSETSISFAD